MTTCDIDQQPEQQTTCDSTITCAEPLVAYSYGQQAALLWICQPEQNKAPDFGKAAFVRFCNVRRKHREAPPADVLHLAAAALLGKADSTASDTSEFWAQYAPALPPADNQPAIQYFLDAFYHTVRNERERLRLVRIAAKEAKQKQDAEDMRRYGFITTPG